MRIGAVILFLNGFCYQSYGWNQIRPLGRLQEVIDALESYECDEITIIRPIRQKDSYDKFIKDIEQIKDINTMTPMSFGGGLRDIKQIDLLHNLPIERLVFSSAFINQNNDLIQYSQSLFGRQAIQCLLPFCINKQNIEIFDFKYNDYVKLDKLHIDFIDEYANEIILFDTKNEGANDDFEKICIDKLSINNSKIIISGGIGKNTIQWAKANDIASVLIENKILHNEYSIKGYKNA